MPLAQLYGVDDGAQVRSLLGLVAFVEFQSVIQFALALSVYTNTSPVGDIATFVADWQLVTVRSALPV
jgi:hypothetical protein